MKKKQNKTAGQIVQRILMIAIIAVAVLIMIFTIISVTTVDKNDRNIFGYKLFIALSDSMSATDFGVDDVVAVREVDPSTLQPGDIITYQSLTPDSFGQIITHKIRRLTTDEQGNPGFITYGTTTDTDDEKVVTYEFVIGKYSFRIPKAGKVFRYVKTPPGYILCILLPFLLIIGLQFVNSIKVYKKYKAEQMEQIQAEKNQLEAERAESQRLMKELMELKEELAKREQADKTENKDN